MHRSGIHPGKEWFGAIGKFDYETATLLEADVGQNRYVVEPVYATDCDNPNHGWILTIVYDGNLHQSEVWIFESHLQTPICRLKLSRSGLKNSAI